jgi:hypothetical protein
MTLQELESEVEELYIKIGSHTGPETEEFDLWIEKAHALDMKIQRHKFPQLFVEPNLEEGQCPYCYDDMTWCEGCRMYSSTCCEQYGTCMCS